MNKLRSGLLFTTLVYGVGGLLQKLVGFIALPIYTRYLSPEEYGVIGLLTPLTTLLLPIFSFGLCVSIGGTYFLKQNLKERLVVIQSAAITCFLGGSIMISICFYFKYEVSYLIFGSEVYSKEVMLAIIGVALSIFYMPLQLQQQFKSEAIAFVAVSLANIILTVLGSLILVVKYQMGAIGMLWGILFGQALTLITLLIINFLSFKKLNKTFYGINAEEVKELIFKGVIIIPSFILIFAMQNAIRWPLEAKYGLDAVGVYSLGSNYGALMSLFTGGVVSAWFPWVMSQAEIWEKARFNVARYFTQYFIIGGLLVVFCFSIAKPFITLSADDRFYEAWTVFGLAAATVFVTSIFSLLLPAIYMAKRVPLIMLSQAVGALITLLSFYILLDDGIYGAALSVLAGATAMVLCQMSINRKLISIPEMPIHYLKLFNRGIIFSVACIVSYNFDTDNYLIFIVKVLLLFSILIYFNRIDLKAAFDEILKSTHLANHFDGSKNVSGDAKKIIIFYDQYSTHTNTVFEHLSAFANFSKHKFAYFHGEGRTTKIKWDQFDALIIHYSLRVALDAISDRLSDQIEKFKGLKVLFVQDEYDFTENTRKAIKKLGIDIVYTCVPAQHIELIYPNKRLQKVKFITNLTGYAPLTQNVRSEIVPIKNRKITVGYRGRALPYWYGDLGQEKEIIARSVKNYCEQKNIISDIEWDDSKRIYGDDWPKFLASIKCTLGTESGSNLFDDDGSIRAKFQEFLAANPGSCYSDARYAVLRDIKEVEIMNQISPRVFEAIACGTALVLFEGSYSGILQPGRHYLSLKKDFSNIDEIFSIISNDEKLQEMVDRAFDEILVGNQYSYKSFIFKFDQMLSKECENKIPGMGSEVEYNRVIKKYPERKKFVPISFLVRYVWMRLPLNMRKSIKPLIREFFNL